METTLNSIVKSPKGKSSWKPLCPAGTADVCGDLAPGRAGGSPGPFSYELCGLNMLSVALVCVSLTVSGKMTWGSDPSVLWDFDEGHMRPGI